MTEATEIPEHGGTDLYRSAIHISANCTHPRRTRIPERVHFISDQVLSTGDQALRFGNARVGDGWYSVELTPYTTSMVSHAPTPPRKYVPYCNFIRDPFLLVVKYNKLELTICLRESRVRAPRITIQTNRGNQFHPQTS